jgi:flagellar protein FliO/FliZ
MDIGQYLQLAVGLIIVLGLMGLFAFLMNYLNRTRAGLVGGAARLKIVEYKMIDPKHKAVILKRDEVEHLILLSQNGQPAILETNIKPTNDA